MRKSEYELFENERIGGIRSYHSLLPPQKRAYNAHHHTQCEISVFLSGSGTYTVGEKQYPFTEGDIFLFGGNEEHCITEIATEIDLLNIQFEPYLLWERAETAEILALFNTRDAAFENKIEDKDGALKKLLLKIEEELCRKQLCYPVVVRYSLFSALTLIVRSHVGIDPAKTVKLSDTTARGLRMTIDHIQQNLAARLELKDLAAIACLSPNYFSYVFKKYNGISLWEYITIKRVEKAIELLKTTSLTKLAISERCGFSSSSNFYKCFLSVTGKHPSDFTKKRFS